MPRRDVPAARTYFDLLAARHPELGVSAAAPAHRARSRTPPPLAPTRRGAGGLATVLALVAVVGGAIVAARLAEPPGRDLGTPGSSLASGSEPGRSPALPGPERPQIDAEEGVVAPPGVDIPTQILPPLASSTEDTGGSVGLQVDDADVELPPVPSPRYNRSLTATALAGEAGRGFERAVKVFAPAPDYPAEAARAGRGGVVLVAARVDETGAVSAVDVRRRVHPALDAAAVAAVSRWLFTPATLAGRPVPDTVQAAVRFVAPSSSPDAPVAPAPATPVVDEPPSRVAAEPAPSALPVAPAAGGVTRPAVRLVSPLPDYPSAAWASGRQGDVTVEVAIEADGSVSEVEVVRGLTAPIDAAAVAAIRRWRFSPALDDGVAVPTRQRYTLRFVPQVAALEPPASG